MEIHISRREVMNNIIRFKDNLLDFKEEEKNKQKNLEKRLYRALVNRKTGDIRFISNGLGLDLKNSHKEQLLEDWQEIQIDVETTAKNQAHFEAKDKHDNALQSNKLEPLAWHILHETLETLNHMAILHTAESSQILPEEAALQDLSDIHLSTMHGTIQEIRGWKGSIDRVGAEIQLKDQPIGTYILRSGDDLTRITATRLADANKMTIEPYICTCVEKNKKISDVLLLHTPQGWTLYRDNPDLFDPEYVYVLSLHGVLMHLHKIAKYPLI